MSASDAVRTHYVADDTLVAKVTALVDGMTPEQFEAANESGFDQFHIRGLAATRELAARAGIDRQTRVLDAGSGFGGPARYLARTYGCRVVGVDLTPAFVAIAKLFADRMGFEELITYEVGDLAALSYADAAFDVVWTQHVVMNVPDRDRVYAEFRRVLVPGGIVAFYDVVAGDSEAAPQYPVPWADSPAESFLLTKTQTLAAFERAGFTVRSWDDLTQEAIAWFAQTPPTAPSGLGLASLLGPRFGSMTANFARNLQDGNLRIALGIAELPNSA
jgi:SAM-dependent methyltransferase